MEPVYYNTFVARTEVAERLQNYRRERVVLDRIRAFAGVVNLGTHVYAMVAQFMKSVVFELQKILDSQHACQPGGLVLSECLPVIN